jgi:AcrR family transcriptional regulator
METLTKRQLEIIDVSIGLIAEKGIQNLTIKNIAEKMNISEPAIYRHFDCKLEILLAILDSFDQRVDALFEQVNQSTAPYTEKLKAFYLARCEEFAKTPELARVIFSEEIFQNEKVLSDKVSIIMQKHQVFIAKIIGQAQENNELRADLPKEHLSLIIMGTLRLMVTRWRMTGFRFDLEKLASEMWMSLEILIKKE